MAYHMLHCSHLVRRLHHTRLVRIVHTPVVHRIEGSHNLVPALGTVDIGHIPRIVGMVDRVGRTVRQAGTSWHWGGNRPMVGRCRDSFAVFAGRDCHLAPQGHLPKS